MSDLMDNFWSTPPIARTLGVSVFAASVALYLGFLPGEWIYFDMWTLKQIPPQIWRLFTNFLVTTPKLGILLDPYFLYSYIAQLETTNPKFSRKEDVVWYLLFVSGVILALTVMFGFSAPFCLQGLILAVAYTGTQDQRGQTANFFFFQIPAQLVPYSMLFVTLFMMGPDYFFLQICGLVAAHLHDFLTRLWPEFGGGRNWIPTPSFLSRVISTRRVEQRGYGTAQFGSAGGGRAVGRSTGAASAGGGPLPDSWKTRGSGHRLGGE